MTTESQTEITRRDALKATGAMAVASTLAGVTVPYVHAAGGDTISIALVGCGGRGSGAAENALLTKQGPTKLVAMADVFESRIKTSHTSLTRKFNMTPDKVEVPEERRFVGFDGYKKAMDCLKAGDVVIMATPPAFRWPMFAYAIEKGLHVFMEKPTTVDGPTTRRMFKLADASEAKNLKVGVGLMCRHCVARQELHDRIRNGELGDITLLRAYRMAGPTAMAFSDPKPDNISELMYQIQRFHSFFWASGGAYSDFLIHNIDESCWMKGSWPVEAKSSGGWVHRDPKRIDQNFDEYSTEFTFADGTKLYLEGRTVAGCHQEFASYVHGTKGSAVVSEQGHWPSHARQFKGHKFDKSEIVWKFEPEKIDPYQKEWEDLMEAIRNDKKYNEARRGAEASLITSMGRMAAHTGQIITRDYILNHEHEFAPDVDKLTPDSPAPILADKDGKYAVPRPGKVKNREF